MKKLRHDQSVSFPTVAPFDTVDARDLLPIAPHVDHLGVGEGTVVAREGEHARQFVVVLSGEVVASRDGAELTRLGPGTQIGAPGVLDGEPHGSTLTATTDLDVLVVSAPALRWAVEAVPALSDAVRGAEAFAPA
jgi:CRP-like cAMP-binding protein